MRTSILGRLARSLLLSFVALSPAACGPMPMMGPGGAPNPYPGAGQGPAAPQAAVCDKSHCSDFCMDMRCKFDEMGIDKCMAVCTSRCGDGFFEDEDAGVMECVLKVGPDLSCGGPDSCCREHLTNQLCAE